jgi:ATP-dependent RNA helicase DHX37/DHR1
MSATLRISDFLENNKLFASPPPVIDVAARQHPVTIHFSRSTHSNYITQAIKKTVNIHRRLPPGGILVFLTGQSDIVGVCKRLEAKFGLNAIEKRRGSDLVVENSVDDKLRSVAISQGCLLSPTHFLLTLVIAPMEVEDLELHDEHGISDSGEQMDEEGDESQEDDNLNQELDANLDCMLPNFLATFWSPDGQHSAHVYCAPLLLITQQKTTTRV